jgi:hypothetical protein
MGRVNGTLWSVEHLWDQTTKHLDRVKADLLVFVDFAKVGNAYGEICKGAKLDDLREMVAVEALDHVESLDRNPFYRQI